MVLNRWTVRVFFSSHGLSTAVCIFVGTVGTDNCGFLSKSCATQISLFSFFFQEKSNDGKSKPPGESLSQRIVPMDQRPANFNTPLLDIPSQVLRFFGIDFFTFSLMYPMSAHKDPPANILPTTPDIILLLYHSAYLSIFPIYRGFVLATALPL